MARKGIYKTNELADIVINAVFGMYYNYNKSKKIENWVNSKYYNSWFEKRKDIKDDKYLINSFTPPKTKILKQISKKCTNIIVNSGIFVNPPKFKFYNFFNIEALGMYHMRSNSLLVAPNICFRDTKQVVKHELIHALQFQYNESLFNNSIFELNKTEYYNEWIEIEANIPLIIEELPELIPIHGYQEFVNFVLQSKLLNSFWNLLYKENKNKLLYYLYNNLYN